MSELAKKEVEFNWTEDFDAGLIRLLLAYRLAEKSSGDPASRLVFEKRLARRFSNDLRALMDAHGPELAVDSDVAALVERTRQAHDGARVREERRMTGGAR